MKMKKVKSLEERVKECEKQIAFLSHCILKLAGKR